MSEKDLSLSDDFHDTLTKDRNEPLSANPLEQIMDDRRMQQDATIEPNTTDAFTPAATPSAEGATAANNANVLTLEQKIGRLLMQRRNQKGLSIEQISETIKIRVRYLEAIEEGRITDIPADVYVKGYIKSYAKLLDITNNQLIENYKPGKITPSEEWQTPISQPGNHFKPKWIVIFVSVLLAVMIYGFWHKSKADQRLEVKPTTSAQPTHMSPIGAFVKGPFKDGGKIVLLANADTWIKVTPANQKAPTTHNLHAGDTLFVPGNQAGFFLAAEKPKSVEVFLDGKTYNFLGTLEEIRSDKKITVQ